MDNEYIAHHGIKGQKWGIRRFQNANGSLTPAGKARYKTAGSLQYPSYEEMQKTVKQKSMEKSYDKALDRKDTKQKISDAQSAINQTNNAINSMKNSYRDAKRLSTLKPDVSKMSNKELQDAITRMNLEDNYTRLIQNREASKKGKDYVEKTLDTLGTVATVASAAAAVAVAINQFKK